MASPIDLSSIVNMIMQLLPLVIILAILPLFIRLFTGFFKE
jgi:capsular polysaccharide biosynthesis protein